MGKKLVNLVAPVILGIGALMGPSDAYADNSTSPEIVKKNNNKYSSVNYCEYLGTSIVIAAGGIFGLSKILEDKPEGNISDY